MYDVNRSGTITKDEFTHILEVGQDIRSHKMTDLRHSTNRLKACFLSFKNITVY